MNWAALTRFIPAACARRLSAGDAAEARRLLGHDFFVVSEVIHGQKLGRTIGFPTANLRISPSCGLRHGIYAVRLTVDGKTHDGVASWGRRPTVDNGEPLLEVYVFDFSGDLYGKQVETAFVEWIRPELKFDGLDALTQQIEQDCADARGILGFRVRRESGWNRITSVMRNSLAVGCSGFRSTFHACGASADGTRANALCPVSSQLSPIIRVTTLSSCHPVEAATGRSITAASFGPSIRSNWNANGCGLTRNWTNDSSIAPGEHSAM
jgi:hypothetical protein